MNTATFIEQCTHINERLRELHEADFTELDGEFNENAYHTQFSLVKNDVERVINVFPALTKMLALAKENGMI